MTLASLLKPREERQVDYDELFHAAPPTAARRARRTDERGTVIRAPRTRAGASAAARNSLFTGGRRARRVIVVALLDADVGRASRGLFK